MKLQWKATNTYDKSNGKLNSIILREVSKLRNKPRLKRVCVFRALGKSSMLDRKHLKTQGDFWCSALGIGNLIFTAAQASIGSS